MKKFFVIISFISILFSQDWQWELPKPFGYGFTDVSFINKDTGWAVGGPGKIVRTYNAGEDWKVLSSPTTNYLIKCKFIGGKGWIVDLNYQIYYTPDYGESWITKTNNQSNKITQLFVLDTNTAWTISPIDTYGVILSKTKDNWKTFRIDTLVAEYPAIPYQFIAINDTLCFISGAACIYRSKDGGKNWELTKYEAIQEYYSIDFIDDKTGWVADRRTGHILKTANGGDSWNQIYDGNDSKELLNLHFYNDKEGIMYSRHSSVFYKSYDGGYKWEKMNINNSFIPGIIICYVNPDLSYCAWYDIHRSTDGNKTWNPTFCKGLAEKFTGIHFFDHDNAVVIGDAISITSDAWKNYKTVVSREDFNNYLAGFKSVPDNNTFTYLASNLRMARTTDKGQTWDITTVPAPNLYTSPIGFCFVSRDSGFVLLGKSLIMTEDGGKYWKEINSFNKIKSKGMLKIFPSGYGYFVDNSSISLLKNFGREWITLREISYPGFFSSSFFISQNLGWVHYYDDENNISKILKIKNLGNDFQEFNQSFAQSRIMVFFDEKKGCILKSDGFMMNSKDGGENWSQEINNIGTVIFDISLQPKGKIFACGIYAILSKVDSNLVSVKEIEPEAVPTTFELKQNYPNPFNPSTTIEYSIPEAGIVTLKVYNVLGMEIDNLVSGYQEAGHHSVTFYGKKYSSGVYFYRLQAGKKFFSKKMILTK